jgi:hypothetical protein
MKKVKVNYDDLKKYLIKEYQMTKSKEKQANILAYTKQDDSALMGQKK